MTPSMVGDCGSLPAAGAAAPRTAVAAAPSQDPVERQRAAARALLQKGDTAGALEANKRLVSAYPSRVDGYAGLGVIYVARHQYEPALAAWQKAADLDPGDGINLFPVGGCYFNLKRNAEARDVFTALTRMKSASPTVLAQSHYMLGLTYLNLGQRDSAMVSYRALTVLDTTFAGKLAARLNEVSTPTGASTPVAATIPAAAAGGQDGSALRAEGKQYFEAKQYAKAQQAYEKALNLNPLNGWALYGLGETLMMNDVDDDNDAAGAAWKRVLTIDTKDTELLLSVGDALHIWLLDPDAIDAYDMVLKLKPDGVTQARAHAGKGWSHYFFMMGGYAAEEFQEAMRLDPANTEYLYALGLTYAKSDQKDKAMAVFKQLTTKNRAQAQKLFEEINKK